MDSTHPQENIRSLQDPYPVDPIQQPFRDFSTYESVVGLYVEGTSIPTVEGAALHLFRPGIGEAKIGYNFFVY